MSPSPVMLSLEIFTFVACLIRLPVVPSNKATALLSDEAGHDTAHTGEIPSIFISHDV
jgi:hypothetical protein